MVSPTPPSTTFIFLVMLILGLLTPFGECDRSDLRVSQCLKVSSSEFVNSVRATIGVLQQVTSILSQFSNGFGDFRLCNAVNDCLDLLDLSFDDLNWSASATESPEGKHNSTGNLSSDLRTWLSAALANPETCMAGFEGTNSIVKGLVSAGLNQVVSLVRQLLNQVEFHPSPNPNHYHKGRGQFPSWIKPWDQKLLQATGFAVDAVVAADGTGNFTRVTDAVEAAPDYSMRRYVIHIKRGVYIENVVIKKKKWNLMMIGDGMAATVISGNRSYVDGWTTFRSATFGVSGRGFIARDITFQNTAGPQKHQAVALRSDSDLSVFYRCGIFGYQDSLYTHTMRQFFRECTIKGTVDFIFGDATVVFQSCQILARKGLPSQKNTITAQGRKDPNEPTGFSIQFCNISADSDLVPFANSTETYLGRPWKTYSRTVFMQSYMSEVVRPRGWLEWDGNLWLDTLYYAEFMNRGPGAGVANRVKWAGFHVLNDSNQARNYTVARFIDGDYWLPSTGVRYTDGLGA